MRPGLDQLLQRDVGPFALLAALALVSGCGGTEYSVSVTFDPPELAASARSVSVSLARACPPAGAMGQKPPGPLRSVEVRRGQEAQPLGPAEPGRYGLHAIAMNGECGVVAAGCTVVDLEEGEGRTLTVVVREATGEGCSEGESCIDGRCEPAQPDGGGPDASQPDASAPDGGGTDPDAAVDGGPDAGADAAPDAAGDAGPDAEADAGLDAGQDAGCDLGDPSIVGSLAINGTKLDVSGTHAYVAGWWEGLRVVDLSDPADPTVVGTAVTPGSAAAVALVEPYAYVAAEWGGLQIVDVGAPENPVIVGSVATPDDALHVSVAGSFAYVAAADAGLRIIDVSDPTDPVEVGFEDAQYALRAYVSGAHAYVPNSWTALRVIDVSDPANPTVEGSIDVTSPWDLAVVGEIVLQATQSGELRIIDVSSPDDPDPVDAIMVTDSHFAVRVYGSRAYMAIAYEGFAVYDVAEPTAPVELFRLDTPGDAHDIGVTGSLAVIKDWKGTLQVIDLGCLAP